jgi:DNA polymerase III delta subunit
MKHSFPKKLTREFLLVDLVNNLHQLGESAEEVLDRVKARLAASDRARVKQAAQSYGSERAKKFFARALAEVGAQDAA